MSLRSGVLPGTRPLASFQQNRVADLDESPPLQTSELVVIAEAANRDVGDFDAQLDHPLRHVVKVDLIAYKVVGVPTSAGVPDFEYVGVSIDQLPVNISSTTGQSNKFVLQLDGARTHQQVTDRVLDQSSTPVDIQRLRVRVFKPDGTLANGTTTGSTDLTGLFLTLRVTQDLLARRFG